MKQSATRRAILKIATGLLKKHGVQRDTTGPVRSLLVLRVDERLGNVLLTTPLLASLKQALPESNLSVLVAARKADILAGNTAIDQLLLFDKRWLFVKPWKLVRLIKRLRRMQFDVVIDASHAHAFSLTHALLALAAGAKQIIGHGRGPVDNLYDVAVPVDSESSDVALKLSLAAPLNVEPLCHRMAFHVDPKQIRPRVRRFIEALGSSARPIAINPGGRKLANRLPDSLVSALLERLTGSGCSVVLLWGPGEARPAARAEDRSAVLVPPATNVHELAAVLGACRGLITGDTGPMHLAVALDVPTFAVFLRPEHARWGHTGERHQAIHHHPGQSDESLLETVGRWLERP